jgi:single-stranded-DNA-specific exonuclease
MNQGQRVGLKLLHSISNSNTSINTKSIGFVLGPRLNAAGRMDDASVAVELLLADTEDRALSLASQLNELNTRRRQAGEKIKEDALFIMDNQRGIHEKKVLVLTESHWHPGIIGIVASQLAKKYSKPVALIAVNDQVGRGSVRSIGGIDILTPLTKCRDLFIDFGGHREAAGFTLKEENIPAFIDCYEQAMSEAINNDDLTPTLNIDAVMNTADLSFELLAELERLAPHGQGNPVPLFASYNLHPYDYRLVGNGSHLKVSFTDKKHRYDAIGFNMGSQISRLKSGPVNIAYTLEINEWQGRRSLQLNLHDIQ